MSSSKNPCSKCSKMFTKKTLMKNDGVCGRCHRASGGISSKKKLTVPKRVREASWKKYIGNTLSGKCYACQCEIQFTNFEAGHVQSEYDGGKINADNIRPICKPCNVSCGVLNLDVFKKSLGIVSEEKKEDDSEEKWIPIILTHIKCEYWVKLGNSIGSVARKIFNNKDYFAQWQKIYNDGGTVYVGSLAGDTQDGSVYITLLGGNLNFNALASSIV